jgi:hypothetical protein
MAELPVSLPAGVVNKGIARFRPKLAVGAADVLRLSTLQ